MNWILQNNNKNNKIVILNHHLVINKSNNNLMKDHFVQWRKIHLLKIMGKKLKKIKVSYNNHKIVQEI